MNIRSGVVHLAAPMALAWSWDKGYGRAPLLGRGRAIVYSRKHACEALDERTGASCWSFRPSGRLGTASGELVVGDSVLAALGPRERMGQINLETGSLVREITWRHQVRLRSEGDSVFGQDATGFWAGTVGHQAQHWRHDASQDGYGWAAGEFAVGQGRLVYGLKEGPVVCLDSRAGREVWRTSIADLTSARTNELERPGEVRGPIAIYGEVVIVESYPQHVIGLSLKTGKRLWTYVGFPMAGLYRGRYYVSAGWLDPHTGRLTRRKALQWPKDVDKGTWGGFLISETHIFVASLLGDIVAWDRETGKHAWHTKAPGANGQAAREPLVSANGRLYYVDQNQRLFCFEEENPTDPILKAQRAAAAGQAGLRAIAAREDLATPAKEAFLPKSRLARGGPLASRVRASRGPKSKP